MCWWWRFFVVRSTLLQRIGSSKAETWNKKVREEGIYVTVPEGAQQVLLFLAPETGGDFSTLRNAVRGRPGAFVRASQDLHQASLDRARLDTYLAAVKSRIPAIPKAAEDQAKLLARSLNIKVDQQCFDKPTEQQAPCLVQNPDSLVLDNGRSATVVQAATSGPPVTCWRKCPTPNRQGVAITAFMSAR